MEDIKNKTIPFTYTADTHYIIIGGWMNNIDNLKKMISRSLPEEQIEIYKWDSRLGYETIAALMILISPLTTLSRWGRSWDISRKNADSEVQKLTERLLKNSDTQLQKTILIGHSLGGRIVAKTLGKLAKKNKKIKGAVLLGAAIKNDNEILKIAADATCEGVKNFFNPNDNVLKYPYGSTGETNWPTKLIGYFIDWLTCFFSWLNGSDRKQTEQPEFLDYKALGRYKNEYGPKNWEDIKVDEQGLLNHRFKVYWASACPPAFEKSGNKD